MHPTEKRPVSIQLHQRSRELELEYSGGEHYHLPCEYLRVYSPSAEVRGHGSGQETLQTGKLKVASAPSNPWAATPCNWCSMTATIPACIPGTTSTNCAPRSPDAGRTISTGWQRPVRAATPTCRLSSSSPRRPGPPAALVHSRPKPT